MTPDAVRPAGTPPPPAAIRTLLVPIDDSELSHLALPVAADLADRLGAEIRLITAVSRQQDVRAARARVERVRVDRLAGGDVLVEARPAEAIRRALRAAPGAVVCMATRGRGRSAAVLGSVAGQVVSEAREPLILVGRSIGHLDGHHWEGEPVDLRPLRGGGVVACVDRAAGADAVVAAAAGWARRLGERLTVIHAVLPEVPPGGLGDRPPDDGGERGPEAFVASLAQQAAVTGADATGMVTADPVSVVGGIRSYLRSSPASLVALHSRNRRGLGRLVLGSTAARIVELSPSPVLMVPR